MIDKLIGWACVIAGGGIWVLALGLIVHRAAWASWRIVSGRRER